MYSALNTFLLKNAGLSFIHMQPAKGAELDKPDTIQFIDQQAKTIDFDWANLNAEKQQLLNRFLLLTYQFRVFYTDSMNQLEAFCSQRQLDKTPITSLPHLLQSAWLQAQAPEKDSRLSTQDAKNSLKQLLKKQHREPHLNNRAFTGRSANSPQEVPDIRIELLPQSASSHLETKREEKTSISPNDDAGIQGVEALFGSMNYAPIPEGQDVLSPTAYFFDLLRISDNLTIASQKTNPNPSLNLWIRRPDLYQIPLNNDSATQLIPTLSVVNQALITHIGITGNVPTDPNAALEKYFKERAQTPHLFLPALLLPWVQITNCFSKQKLSYSDLINAVSPNLTQTFLKSQPHPQRLLWFGNSNISPEDYWAFQFPESTTTLLQTRYSKLGVDEKTQAAPIPNLLKQLPLTYSQWTDLILRPDAAPSRRDTSQFYVNQVTNESPMKLQLGESDERIINFSPEKFNRLAMFTSIAQKLGWSYDTLEQVLTYMPSGFHATEISNMPVTTLSGMAWLNNTLNADPIALCAVFSVFDNTYFETQLNLGNTNLLLIDNNFATSLQSLLDTLKALINTPESTMVLDPTKKLDLNLAIRLCTAFGIDINTLYYIAEPLLNVWEAHDDTFSDAKFILSRLSWLSTVANALNLHVLECLEVYGFFNQSTHQVDESLATYYSELAQAFLSQPLATSPEEAQGIFAQMDALNDYAQGLNALNIDFSQLRFITWGIESKSATLRATLVSAVQKQLESLRADFLSESKAEEAPTASSTPLPVHLEPLLLQTMAVLQQSFSFDADTLHKLFMQFFMYRPEIAKFLQADPNVKTLSTQSLQDIYRLCLCAKTLNLKTDTREERTDTDAVSLLAQSLGTQKNSSNPLSISSGFLVLIQKISQLSQQASDHDGKILWYLQSNQFKLLSDFLSVNLVTLKYLFSLFTPDVTKATFIEKVGYLLDADSTLSFMKQLHAKDANMLLQHQQTLSSMYDNDYTQPQSEDYDRYANIAKAFSALFSRTLPKAYRNALGGVLEQSRNALLNDAISKLATPQLPLYDADAWSDYLLQDVLMSGCENTSLIICGTQALRVFLQRCRLGLETASYLSGISSNTIKQEIPESWWSWLQEYRLWQANREVLLYPEDYLDPQLRTDASKEYNDLMYALSGAQPLDDTNVRTSMLTYLNALQTLSKLVPVDLFLLQQDGIDTPQSYLLARTQHFPPQYYYRLFFGPTVSSKNPNISKPFPNNSYWEKIDVKIPTPFVSMVYAFNRLFLFWVEAKFKSQTTLSSSTKVENSAIISVTIRYVYQETSTTWSSIQTLIDKWEFSADTLAAFSQGSNSKPQITNVENIVFGKLDDMINYSLNTVKVAYNQTKDIIEIEYIPIDDPVQNKGIAGISYQSSVTKAWKISSDFSVYSDDPVEEKNEPVIPTTEPPNNPLINYSSSLFMRNSQGRAGNLWNLASGLSFQMGTAENPLSYYSPTPKVVTLSSCYVGAENHLTYQLSAHILKPCYPSSTQHGSTVDVEMNQGILMLKDDAPFVDIMNARTTKTDDFSNPLESLLGYTATIHLGNVSLLLLPRTPLKLIPPKTVFPPYSKVWTESPYFEQYYQITPLGSDAISNTLYYAQNNSIHNFYENTTIPRKFKYNSFLPPIGAPIESNLAKQFNPNPTLMFFTPVVKNSFALGNPLMDVGGVNWSEKPRLENTTHMSIQLPPYRFDKLIEEPVKYELVKLLPDRIPINYNSGFASYYWELFFHVPMLMAKLYRQQQNFKQAQAWLHHVYNPINPIFLPMYAGLIKPIVTPFLFPPLNSSLEDNLEEYLTDKDVLDVYHQHSFDPFRLAEVHRIAFKKYVVLQYIELLLDWGDYLYTQNTRETIANALIYYHLADELLGPKPHPVISTTSADVFLDIKQVKSLPATIPPAPALWLLQDSSQTWYLMGTDGKGKPVNGSLSSLVGSSAQPGTYPDLASLADFLNQLNDLTLLLQDQTLQQQALQLTKLGLGISDKVLNAAQLLTLGKNPNAGTPIPHEDDEEVIVPIPGDTPQQQTYPYNDITGIYFKVPPNTQLTTLWDKLADRLYKIRHCESITGQYEQLPLLSPPISPEDLLHDQASGAVGQHKLVALPYRFSTVSAYAEKYVNDLIGLNARLLSALENKDASQLANLQVQYQNTASNWQVNLAQMELDAIDVQMELLQAELDNANYQVDYYTQLIKLGLLPEEKSAERLNAAAIAPMGVGMASNLVAAIAAVAPEVNAPWSVSEGGVQISQAASFAAATSLTLAQILQASASLSAQMGADKRRSQEWQNQLTLAQNQSQQIQLKIADLNNQQQILQERLSMQQSELAYRQKVLDFYQSRFTSAQLYSWMSGQLTQYSQTTFAVAKVFVRYAELAMFRELAVSSQNSQVENIYWMAAQNGLSSGESLQNALRNIESQYLKDNARKLIAQAPISVKKAADIKDFKELSSKPITFQVNLNDKNALLTSLTVNVLGLSGPYQDYHLLLQVKEGGWGVNQMRISSGINENGLMRFQDDMNRYLPFEGLALDKNSEWTLQVYNASSDDSMDYSKITDVILNIEYSVPAAAHPSLGRSRPIDTIGFYGKRHQQSGSPEERTDGHEVKSAI